MDLAGLTTDGSSSVETLIVAAPLAGALLLLAVGKRLGRISAIVAVVAMLVSLAGSIVVFLDIHAATQAATETGEHLAGEGAASYTVRLFEWITVADFSVAVDFLIDPLSAVMLLVVTGVGTLIHIYSIAYMRDDERFSRFFAYLNLFVAFMLILVLADNLLLLYVGWEGVGLCSYLLIGFWFEKKSASDAAKKAFIVNRIGDFAFLLGIFVLAGAVGSLTFGAINTGAGAMGAGIATIASLLLFAGATGKSAQIPLYVWLPDAMEGPTPVSALIHAATMVTAGVYMVARLSPVFVASEGTALLVVGWIGALTALWAAVMAATEYDIKRVLAYSTISQLGYMFLAHGVGAFSAGIFHLVTHAFFKALMFLAAGAVMHGLANRTDMREMGGLRKAMPITAYTFLFGWLAISGIAPFAGFWSKDAILASAWAQGEYALWGMGVATAALTAFYMSRLYFRVFEGRSRVPEGIHPHDATPLMAVALIPLALLSLVAGVINLPGSLELEHLLEPVVGGVHVPSGITPWVLGGTALLAALAGIFAARGLYLHRAGNVRRRRLISMTGGLVEAARNKFYVDEIYGRGIVLPGKRLACFLAEWVDRRVIDGALMGSGAIVARMGETLRRLQSGFVRNYAVSFLLGAVVLLSIVVMRVSLA